jgi:mannosyltransferase OCH1-like enzyme
MKPPLIQYWHTAHIPREIRELFAQMRDHNPNMQQMIFSKDSARGLIKRHFTAREVAAFDACAVPAMQSDYFGYCAVSALGGMYCDADCLCTNSLLPLIDAEGVLFESARLRGWLSNGMNRPGFLGDPFHWELNSARWFASNSTGGISPQAPWSLR